MCILLFYSSIMKLHDKYIPKTKIYHSFSSKVYVLFYSTGFEGIFYTYHLFSVSEVDMECYPCIPMVYTKSGLKRGSTQNPQRLKLKKSDSDSEDIDVEQDEELEARKNKCHFNSFET